ncbi:MAG: hypothetical protein JNM80_08625 [Phycisphaerae bacterium]|nr:hypothetical protein [Phycisphaerae bacterium]
MPPSRRVVVWLAPHQTQLVRQIADLAQLQLVGVGTASRGQGVASELDAPSHDDLRAALAATPADLVWIASPGSFGVSSDDASALDEAHRRGTRVATLEPIPASALVLGEPAWNAVIGAGAIRFIPSMRAAPSLRDAAEVVAAFGEITALLVESLGSPREGTLGARFYAALDLVLGFLGEPETIDAAYVSPVPGPALHALPSESLRDLSGHLTANLRYADGRAAAVAASDHAGRWSRVVTLLGPSGRLRCYDDGFEWIGPEGERRDQSRSTRVRGQEPATPPAAAAIADALSRMLDPSVPDVGPGDHATVLAMGQAALLSARTAQAESPVTIKRMVGTA